MMIRGYGLGGGRGEGGCISHIEMDHAAKTTSKSQSHLKQQVLTFIHPFRTNQGLCSVLSSLKTKTGRVATV